MFWVILKQFLKQKAREIWVGLKIFSIGAICAVIIAGAVVGISYLIGLGTYHFFKTSHAITQFMIEGSLRQDTFFDSMTALGWFEILGVGILFLIVISRLTTIIKVNGGINMGRKILQAVSAPKDCIVPSMGMYVGSVAFYAVCSDGTVWAFSTLGEWYLCKSLPQGGD
jgi:hypothetical protein